MAEHHFLDLLSPSFLLLLPGPVLLKCHFLPGESPGPLLLARCQQGLSLVMSHDELRARL